MQDTKKECNRWLLQAQDDFRFVKKLDRFYIPTRYPNGLPGGSPFQLFNEKDLAEAYDDLKEIMEKVTSFIKTIR